MAEDPMMAKLLAELATLTLLSARQSTAVGNLLIAKNLVTQDELDQYMRSSSEVTEKAESLVRQLREQYRGKS